MAGKGKQVKHHLRALALVLVPAAIGFLLLWLFMPASAAFVAVIFGAMFLAPVFRQLRILWQVHALKRHAPTPSDAVGHVPHDYQQGYQPQPPAAPSTPAAGLPAHPNMADDEEQPRASYDAIPLPPMLQQ
jgi:hypothetical protein